MQKSSSKYQVEFIDDLFGDNNALAELIGEHKVLLIADQNVVQHVPNLGTKIGTYVKTHNLALASAPVVLSGGERIKIDIMQGPMRVANAFIKAKLDADDVVLALGGGAVSDVVGWTVAQMKHKLRLIRIPTTPAAMLDAAFATTSSLDMPMVKDAFTVQSEPFAILISTGFAATVLDGVWRAGISEAIRLAAAHDPKLLTKYLPLIEDYRTRNLDALAEIVHATIKLRLKKGGTDLGLKSAAEFEPRSGWKLPHGYAVGIGTLLELSAAVKAGTVKEQVLNDAHAFLKGCGALDGLYHSRHILPPEARNFW